MENKKMKAKFTSIICIILAIIIPFTTQKNYTLVLFDQTIVSIIAVLGLNFTMGLSGHFDFSSAAIFGLGSYTTAIFCVKLGLPPWIGVFFSIIIGILIGITIGYPSLRLRGAYFTLATLGFLEVTRLLLTNMTEITNGTYGMAGIPSLKIFGIDFGDNRNFYFMALCFLLLAIYISDRVIKSKWGRMLIAINDNDIAVDGCGINKSSVKIKAYILGSCFMTFAGALNAHLIRFIHPADFNFDFTVKFIMMLMLGGIGSIPGCIIGGIVVTILPELLKVMGEYYWLAFTTSMLIMIMFMPYGLVSLPKFIKNKIRAKKGKDRVLTQ